MAGRSARTDGPSAGREHSAVGGGGRAARTGAAARLRPGVRGFGEVGVPAQRRARHAEEADQRAMRISLGRAEAVWQSMRHQRAGEVPVQGHARPVQQQRAPQRPLGRTRRVRHHQPDVDRLARVAAVAVGVPALVHHVVVIQRLVDLRRGSVRLREEHLRAHLAKKE